MNFVYRCKEMGDALRKLTVFQSVNCYLQGFEKDGNTSVFPKVFQNTHLIKRNLFRSFYLFLVFIIFPIQMALAQPELQRVSITERADGLGYVIRLHLTQAVNSFEFDQPEMDRIEISLFSLRIQSQSPVQLPEHPILESIRQEPLADQNGLRLTFQLSSIQQFRARIYPDVNGRDLLLGLEFVEGEGESESESEGESEGEEDKVEVKIKRRVLAGDPLEFYLRWIAEDVGAARSTNHLRYSGSSLNTNDIQLPAQHPWSNQSTFSTPPHNLSLNLNVFDPILTTTHNSHYPYGQNDGALWQGKGFNHTFTMGFGYLNDYLEVVFNPIFVSSQNQPFDLSPHPQYEGLSQYVMALTYADIPQRFGEDSINRLDMGDSFLRGIYKGWTAGFSNERIRTGPAINNPLLFGYHAPGFFHSFVGTDEPFEALKGRFDTRLFWGSLRDSDYFHESPTDSDLNRSRYITGFSLNYNPDFLPGLHLGFTRTAVSYFPQNGLGFEDLLMAFKRSQEKGLDTTPDEARFIKTALFVRWYFPEAGFETYVEWGRNDNRRGVRDMIAEPELNRGYVLGFLKRFYAGPSGRIVVNGEITNLENLAVTAQSRDFNIWYTDPIIQQGFTHRGQVMGASIGPGSSTQMMNVSYYNRFGFTGFTLGRIVYQNDRLFKNSEYYQLTLPRQWMTLRRIHEVEMYGSLQGLIFLPYNFEMQFNVRYGLIENRHNQYIRTMEVDFEDIFFDEPNWNLNVSLRYRI